MREAYLLIGLLALLGVMLAGFTAHRLVLKSRGAAALPAGLGKIPATKQPVLCPMCGGENHPAARGCLHCGGTLTPLESSEAEQC